MGIRFPYAYISDLLINEWMEQLYGSNFRTQSLCGCGRGAEFQPGSRAAAPVPISRQPEYPGPGTRVWRGVIRAAWANATFDDGGASLVAHGAGSHRHTAAYERGDEQP